MSNPSFSNIDLWLFELAEGNLSPAQVEQLEVFLLHHPELEIEKDVWEMAKVNSDSIPFENQEKLEKRRPVAWYAGFGIATLLLISTAVGYGYFQWNSATTALSGIQNSETQVKARLLNEINSLKEKLDHSQKSHVEVESLNSNIYSEDETSHSNVANNATKGAGNNSAMVSNNSKLVQQNVSANHNDTNLSAGNVVSQSSSALLKTNVNSHAVTHNLDANINNVSQGKNEVVTLSADDIANVEMNDVTDNSADNSFTTNEVEELVVLDESFHSQITKNNGSSHTFSSEKYKITFKSRLNKMARAMQRMMDNPVALANYRDPYYHVPGMLPGDINFSSAGTMLSTRVQASSRLQWYGKDNEQLLSQLAVDGYAHGMRGGLGLQLNHAMYNDGGVNIAGAALTYSPKLSLTKKISLEPSLRFKMGNKSLTKSKMENVDQVELDRGNSHDFYTNGQQIIGTDQWYKDLGAGLMVNTEWFFAGVQLDNLFRHKDNIYSNNVIDPRKSDYHFIGTLGTDWVSKKENISVSPYFVYQNMGRLSEGWLGVNLRMNWLTVGGAISSNYEPSGSIGVKFDRFAMAYNADYTNSQMLGNKALSHQLTIRFVSKPSRFGKGILNH